MALSSIRDPRVYQIAALSSVLAFGWTARAFEIEPIQFAAVVATCCAVQWLGSFLIASRADYKSALVTSLSLTLLLRADAIWPLVIAAAIAIFSKFSIRLNGKHIFNPANIGIVTMILLTDAAWTTPGQWGTALWFALALAGAGMFVTYRAARIDVPLIFLGGYAGLMVARALWLGDPLTIPLLRLENGALILFSFFMISDPKTTPDGAVSRAVFAFGAALIAFVLNFNFFNSDGIFYALFIMTMLRPLLEWLDPAPRYRWGDPVSPPKLLKRLQPKPAAAPHPAPAE